jgi:hypothetical protein
MDTNVTLISVLLLILLYIPGYLFKRFYYKGPFVQQFHFGLFAERFATSIFWGILMQVLSLVVSKKLIDFSYENLRVPVSEFYTNLCHDKLPDLTFENIQNIGLYFSVTILVSILMGWILHHIVRLLRIDHYVSALQFQNKWHYYFKGEKISPINKSKSTNVISTDVDILSMDGAGGTKLYSGFLEDYTVSSKNGELETITIRSCSRYSKTKGEFIPIKGDCLIIPFDKIININLRFNRADKIPLASKISACLTILFLITILFVCFYIPIKFSHLGLLKVFTSVLLFLLLLILLLLTIVSPFLKVERSTIKSRFYVFSFFLLLSLIVLKILNIILELFHFQYPFSILNF